MKYKVGDKVKVKAIVVRYRGGKIVIYNREGDIIQNFGDKFLIKLDEEVFFKGKTAGNKLVVRSCDLTLIDLTSRYVY